MATRYTDDEDDDWDDDDVQVDEDMLPTLLIYRAGDLVFTWVRVDWEAGSGSVEELLRKYAVPLFHHLG